MTDQDEIQRRMREARAKRDAIPEDERTEFARTDRFIGAPIGVGDDGEFFPENRGGASGADAANGAGDEAGTGDVEPDVAEDVP